MNQPSNPLSFNLGLIPGVTSLFAEGELPQRLASARAHGFTGVEGSAPADPGMLRRLLEDHGMQFVCMSLGRGSTEAEALGTAALPGRQAVFREALLRGIDAAAAMSCTRIHPLGGLVPPQEDRATCQAIYIDNLRVACEEAGRAGIEVLIEPICAVRQPRYILQTHALAIEIIRSLGAANLRLMADMFHAHMSGESTAEIARLHADVIGLMQVADAPVRRQPSLDDERLRATLRALAANQWQGWISAEYVPEGELDESLAWTGQLGQQAT